MNKKDLELEKKIDEEINVDQSIQKDPEILSRTKSDLHFLPIDLQFETLLHRKTMGKDANQQSSMKKYYRDLYKKTGVIPEGMLHREGRKASGRKSSLPKEVEKSFIDIVQASADDDINAPDFITKNLRTVVNFHRRLEDEFGEISLHSLYRLVSKHELKKYLDKPDCNNEQLSEILDCFESIPVFDMIQIDGCRFKYIEIKDDDGEWRRPLVIEIMDVGSRCMLSLNVFFSESNETSIQVFTEFLKSADFPLKTIKIRPDQAKNFLNLMRPIYELNLKYSFPGKFYFAEDFARPGKPKDKPHLESSHRRLHGFEDYFIVKLPSEKLVERVPGVKIKTGSGKIEIVTISRFDINLEELRESGLIQRYIKDHNERLRTFSESGSQAKWAPKKKLEEYLKSVETFKFQEDDIENCLKYGFRKEKATVAPNGKIRFQKCDYKVVTGNFYGGRKNVKVKVSKYENKLYIFEPGEAGVSLGEAMLLSEFEKPERVKKAKEHRLKKNEFEQIVTYLEGQGMTIKKAQSERLMGIYRQGLNLDKVVEIIELHKKTYESYLNNSEFSRLQVGGILCNLFFAHYSEYEKGRSLIK